MHDLGWTAQFSSCARRQQFDHLFPQQQIGTHRPHATGVADVTAGVGLSVDQLLAAEFGQVIRRAPGGVLLWAPTRARPHRFSQCRRREAVRSRGQPYHRVHHVTVAGFIQIQARQSPGAPQGLGRSRGSMCSWTRQWALILSSCSRCGVRHSEEDLHLPRGWAFSTLWKMPIRRRRFSERVSPTDSPPLIYNALKLRGYQPLRVRSSSRCPASAKPVSTGRRVPAAWAALSRADLRSGASAVALSVVRNARSQSGAGVPRSAPRAFRMCPLPSESGLGVPRRMPFTPQTPTPAGAAAGPAQSPAPKTAG